MILLRILSILFFIELIVKVPVFANDTIVYKQLLASFSGVLQRCVFQDNKISSAEKILNNGRWTHVYWPSFNKAKGIIYFFAKDSLMKGARAGIYRLSLLVPNQEPKKIINNARLPSLSPDNKNIAFYRHPNQLWIHSLIEVDEKKIASDMSNYQPCVWVSKTQMLYIDLSKNLVLIDITKGEKQKTGYKSIVPGALSLDGKMVLCGSSDGKKIYVYLPLSNELKLIKKNKFKSIGTSFVWLPDGTGFLFTMQTWSSILKLNESRDLFLYVISENDEYFLFPRIALFGGVFIPFGNID